MTLDLKPDAKAASQWAPSGDLDQALETLSAYDHRLSGGPYSHAPMVAEALEALGEASGIPAYIERQLSSGAMIKRPQRQAEIDPAHPPYGDETRLSDWTHFFVWAISGKGVESTLRAWLPLLTPTAYAAAGHALIRLGHALRSVERHDTAARRAELAGALASWACTHHASRLDLGAPTSSLSPQEALAGFPLCAEPASTETISGGIGAAFALPGFSDAVRAVDLSGEDAAEDLIKLFAAQFVDHAVSPFTAMAHCHAVTASAAARTVGLWLPRADAEALFRVAFATGAAIRSGFARLHDGENPGADDEFGPAELTRRAVELGVDHAIKFTETCLAAYARTADEVLLKAANRGVRLLGEE